MLLWARRWRSTRNACNDAVLMTFVRIFSVIIIITIAFVVVIWLAYFALLAAASGNLY